jgi:serine/threonine protein kinase
MNRSIDTRSDLYSLGVTFYEMLMGLLPFAAADPLDWVHCHLARQPTPPVGCAAVPEPLSAITVKLLAENAEERYQTASGLGADPLQCLEEWESHGRIDPFPLGAHDSSDRLLIPEKLYERDGVIASLQGGSPFSEKVSNLTLPGVGEPPLNLQLWLGHHRVGRQSLGVERQPP